MKKINLSIPQPCHEDWDGMTQMEKGKFCASCQKTVIDFTSMSDRELVAFFKKPVGSVCGRFHQVQLDRDIVVPRKRIPWIRYFFQFTWPAFVLFLKSCGPREKAVGQVSRTIEDVRKISDTNTRYDKVVGLITLPAESPADSATVKGGTKSGITRSDIDTLKMVTDADSMGMVLSEEADYLDSGLEIPDEPAIGTDTAVISRNVMDTVVVCSKGVIRGDMLVGEVSINNVKPSKRPVNVTENERVKEQVFVLYPNPVSRGTSVKIDLQQFEAGEYAVVLINNAGQTIQTEKIFVENKNQVITFVLPGVTAGSYFIQLIHQESGKHYTEKLILQ
jgi:hypothetical protein